MYVSLWSIRNGCERDPNLFKGVVQETLFYLTSGCPVSSLQVYHHIWCIYTNSTHFLNSRAFVQYSIPLDVCSGLRSVYIRQLWVVPVPVAAVVEPVWSFGVRARPLMKPPVCEHEFDVKVQIRSADFYKHTDSLGPWHTKTTVEASVSVCRGSFRGMLHMSALAIQCIRIKAKVTKTSKLKTVQT